MKSLSKIAALATGLLTIAFAVFSSAPVFADSPGQLATGPYVYRVKDVTTGGSYAGTISANACDVVQYTTQLNNGGYGNLTNVIVKATLPASSTTSVSSTVTATPDQGAAYGTTGTAVVNFSSAQSFSYVAGSAKLYDSSSNLIRTLPDTITASGVNVGSVNGSTTEFVIYQAKASGCSTPTPAPTPTTPSFTQATKATVLPNTGPGDVLGIFTGASAAGGIGHYFVSRRRRH